MVKRVFKLFQILLSPIFNKYFLIEPSFVFADSTTKTPATRDAFHPQSVQHWVHLPVGTRVRGGLHHKRQQDSSSAWTVQVFSVQHKLHARLEVGEESCQRYMTPKHDNLNSQFLNVFMVCWISPKKQFIWELRNSTNNFKRASQNNVKAYQHQWSRVGALLNDSEWWILLSRLEIWYS